MTVRLVSYSQPTEEFRDQGLNDLRDLVAYCARVSNPSNQLNTETSDRLIRYLIEHQHWSPLEMVSACLEITTTRDIARQILRHRSFSFQEFSQRYADPTQNLDFAVREARLQDKRNRQSSQDLDTANNIQHREIYQEWYQRQLAVIRQARETYQWAVDSGIAKEQARVVLPEGLTESRIYMSGSMRSWYHYCQLRSSKGTQKEHQSIAVSCANILDSVWPGFVELMGSSDQS